MWFVIKFKPSTLWQKIIQYIEINIKLNLKYILVYQKYIYNTSCIQNSSIINVRQYFDKYYMNNTEKQRHFPIHYITFKVTSHLRNVEILASVLSNL